MTRFIYTSQKTFRKYHTNVIIRQLDAFCKKYGCFIITDDFSIKLSDPVMIFVIYVQKYCHRIILLQETSKSYFIGILLNIYIYYKQFDAGKIKIHIKSTSNNIA